VQNSLRTHQKTTNNQRRQIPQRIPHTIETQGETFNSCSKNLEEFELLEILEKKWSHLTQSDREKELEDCYDTSSMQSPSFFAFHNPTRKKLKSSPKLRLTGLCSFEAVCCDGSHANE
jgi:hypothetical protein